MTAEQLFSQVPIGITIFRGPDFVVEAANDAYLEIIDRTPEFFIGKPLFDVLPEVRSAVEPLLDQVYRKGIPYHGRGFEVTLNRHGKQELTYFNFEYRPLRENDQITGVIVVASEVTDQVLRKQSIEENERRFRTFIDQSPIAMCIFRGKDMVIEIANKALLTLIWRRTAEEVIGKKLMDVFTELAGQRFPALIGQVLRTGKAHSEKEALGFVEGKDGKRAFYVDFDYSPLFTKAGESDAIMVTASDVTEKVKARHSLEVAEERARLATEASLAGVFDIDLHTGGTNCSPRFFEIMDLPPSASRADWLGRVHPDDRPARDKAWNDGLKSGVLHYEIRIKTGSGAVRWIRSQGRVYKDDNAEPVRVLGTILDITEKVKADEALIDSERKFRHLSNALPTLVWTATADGKSYTYNESVYSYSGLSVEELDRLGWSELVHSDDLDDNIRLWAESLQTGRPYLYEHRLRRYDGTYRWMLTRAIAQRNDSGQIISWVGTTTDINEQKQFSEELEHKVMERTAELQIANTELALRNQELLSFNYISSHDLQEPLRKIQTFASRIRGTESQLTPQNEIYFQRMQQSAKQMQMLIRDLLEYSRAGEGERNFETVDLGEIVQRVKQQLLEDNESSRLHIDVRDLPTVRAIPFQINQLFSNLLSNAVKFSRKTEHPVICVDASYQQDGNYHVIRVTDNGIGFQPEYKEKIFEVFRRLHNRSEYEGTGVGLAICKKIAGNHNGFITAEGHPGEGATFTVFLPA
jgi:PAS domain S-box-containing protein